MGKVLGLVKNKKTISFLIALAIFKWLVLTSKLYVNLIWIIAATISIETGWHSLCFLIVVLEVLSSIAVIWFLIYKIVPIVKVLID